MSPPYHFNELTTWHQCRLRHHYEYVRRYAPLRKPEALDFGALIHTALEMLYLKGEGYVGIIEKECADRLAELRESTWGLDETDQKKYIRFQKEATTIMRLYAQQYGTDYPHETIGLEAEYPVKGVPDLVRTVDRITLKDDVRYAWEHKTTSKTREQFLDSLAVSMEPALTCLAAESNWIIYNVLNKNGSSKDMFWRETLYVSDKQKAWAQEWAYDTIFEMNDLSYIMTANYGYQCNYCSMKAACACEITGGDVQYILDHNYRVKGKEER